MTESGKEHILLLGMVYSEETIPKRGKEFRDRGSYMALEDLASIIFIL